MNEVVGKLSLICFAGAWLLGCNGINRNDIDRTPDDSFRPPVESPAPFRGWSRVAAEAPPPVTGGHLTTLPSLDLVAAADPDLRRLALVRVSTRSLESEHELPGEPGRVVADEHGRVHVVIRDLGTIYSLDVATSATELRSVCSSPRGLEWDGEREHLLVACLDGRIQHLPSTGGEATTFVEVEGADLRDIVAQPEGLWVSRFRSAELVLLSREGEELNRVSIPTLSSGRETLIASVAWRIRAREGGGLLVSHQRHTDRAVSITAVQRDEIAFDSSAGYGGGVNPSTGECVAPLVSSAVTEIGASGAVVRASSVRSALPVDVSADGERRPAVAVAAVDDNLSSGVARSIGTGDERCGVLSRDSFETFPGQTVSVDHFATTQISQTRLPAIVRIGNHEVRFGPRHGDPDGRDAGHALFHARTTSDIACASCHPEGGEDGIRWPFFGVGLRRTQELRGGILATAPFHWDGDMPTLDSIMEDVFDSRMGGGAPNVEQRHAIATWVDAMPLPNLDVDRADAEAGRAIFDREGCAECHSGPVFTNNENVDVGRGALQVPTLLGVALRSPWMHDGCAPTLREAATGACAGEDHHFGERVSREEAELLVTYLRSL